MSKTLDTLSQLIRNSSLSLNDQNDLLVFLPALPEQLIEDLVELFRKKPELIIEFNKNFRAKLDILIDGRDRFEKLIAHEEEMLEQEEEKRLRGGREEDFNL